jgi:glycosyltransferase involved in cell wall biosynthesis
MASSKKRSRLRALLQRHLAGRANAIIANSHAALLDAVAVDGIDLQRGHVIPNLITDSAFARVDPVPLERVGPVLVTVANLRPEKGQGDALAAARMMKASGLEFQWILVGGGDYAASLQRQAAEYGLPIILAGSVADPRPYLAAADIYVHPSWSEGMSNAVLEAMAAGLPVVATDVGGTAEALAGAGVLVHPRDPASLANSLIRLWGRSADRESMSSASRQRAQDFRVESCVAAHLDVYREAIGRFEGLSASPGPMLRK